MTLKLYNTLTKSKADFTPIDAKNIGMYVCGPTVYSYAHIGNARPVIVFDVLYRLLRHLYGADHVRYVRNITDVDDKINARAAEDFPGMALNDAIAKVTVQTTEQFHKDIATLGVLPPSIEPKCTGHIPQMIAMIEVLLAKGFAYVAEGHVLLDVGSVAGYGRLSRRSLDEMIAGARIEVAPYKKNPADSVLWKPSSDEQPGWDSPWGRGRPGWHIECSAMAKQHLGEVFDIHGGGIDLQFPHHENELAQSCSAHGTDIMAKIWMHNGFLQVEGQKMSKSLGNFITIHQLLDTPDFGGRNWPGEVLRLAMLRTHYRQPIDWTAKALEEAHTTLERLYERAAKATTKKVIDAQLLAALADDLNTPQAIARLHQVEDPDAIAGSLQLLGFTLNAQALRGSADIADSEIEKLIAARLAHIKAQEWNEADRIRDELLAQNVQLKDGKNPETGVRITTWEIKS